MTLFACVCVCVLLVVRDAHSKTPAHTSTQRFGVFWFSFQKDLFFVLILNSDNKHARREASPFHPVGHVPFVVVCLFFWFGWFSKCVTSDALALKLLCNAQGETVARNTRKKKRECLIFFFCVVRGVALIGITFVPDSARTDVYTVDTFRRLAGGKGLDLFFLFPSHPLCFTFQEECYPRKEGEKK
jgi:hypothetical protein